ncbi:MAG: D-alanyl-D-alanine carboxypeptidase [Eubacterium sp.]|nr:D-alanyl-D-alanine carboxypeptidase [Eubacterium sp.]
MINVHKNEGRKILQKSIAFVLCVFFLFSTFTCLANDNIDEADKITTKISGIASSINALRESTLERTITVTPANGTRTVRLQLYNSKEKMYKTIKKYVTADADSAKIKIVFPKKHRKKVCGKWRIYVSKTKEARSAEKYINITTRNIVHKELHSKAACIICVDDNKIIYVKNSQKELKQASTTKVMTAALFFESENKLNDYVRVSNKASNTPYSTPWMAPGDSYTFRALLHAMLLKSSNGAAVSIAEGVSGTTKLFVKEMNNKAKELGMNHTHYTNPHGLDAKKHYSCAHDVAYIMGYTYKNNKTFREIIAKKKYTVKSKRGRKQVVNTTDLMKDYSDKHKGGKTGYTSGAGLCFTSIYEHKGKDYAVCVLGAKKAEYRWSDMKKLYKYIDKYASTKY